LASMAVTLGIFNDICGLPKATGLVGLMLMHEAGHVLVMAYRNIPFKPIIFIPIFGTATKMRQEPKDAYEEAIVAYGGPAVGGRGAIGLALAAYHIQSMLLSGITDAALTANFISLMPSPFLDGGRIIGAVGKYGIMASVGVGEVLTYNPMTQPFISFYRGMDLRTSVASLTQLICRQTITISAGKSELA
jgi:Zn-dependent protease